MDLAAGIRGKRAFVTGASSGLGAHFARVLAGCGAAVAIGARRRERLDALARELGAAGAETTVAVDLDVADESSVSRALRRRRGGDRASRRPRQQRRHRRRRRLRSTPRRRPSTASSRRTCAASGSCRSRRPSAGARPSAAARSSTSPRSSACAFRAARRAYAVSKAGVVQMTEAHALEWARYGIRVNALAPGYIATDINAGFFATEHGQAMLKRIPHAPARATGGPRRRLPAPLFGRLALDDRRDDPGRRRAPRVDAVRNAHCHSGRAEREPGTHRSPTRESRCDSSFQPVVFMGSGLGAARTPGMTRVSEP